MSNDPDEVLNVAETKLTVPGEGVVLHPYRDPRGIWTIGTGSTFDLDGSPVTAETPPITPAQNLVLLKREMMSAFTTVENSVPVPLSVDEEAVLDDFVFNAGAGNFLHSSVLACLKSGDYEGAANHLLDWDRAGGVVLAGLARRCAARRALFLKPDAPT